MKPDDLLLCYLPAEHLANLYGVAVQTIYNWRWRKKHPKKQQEYNRASWRRIKARNKREVLAGRRSPRARGKTP